MKRAATVVPVGATAPGQAWMRVAVAYLGGRQPRGVSGVPERVSGACVVGCYRPGMDLERRWLGRIPYRAAWRLQHDLVDARAREEVGDTLLLLEHPRVLTLGRQSDPSFVRAAEAWSRERGLPDVRLDVYEFNAGARRLYERLGYRTYRRQMRRVHGS